MCNEMSDTTLLPATTLDQAPSGRTLLGGPQRSRMLRPAASILLLLVASAWTASSAEDRSESTPGTGMRVALEARASDSNDGAGSWLDLDVVVPLYLGRNEDWGIFVQPGFVLSLGGGARDQYGLSLGSGYRFLSSGRVYGVNAFYDRNWVEDDFWQESLTHERVSVGVDYQDDRNHFSANYYHRLSGDYQRYDLTAHHREYATSALDGFYRASLGEEWSSRSRIYYEFDRDFEEPIAFRSDGENRLVVSSGIDYRFRCHASVGAHVAHDFLTRETTPSITLNIAFGGNAVEAACRAGRRDDARRRLFNPVEREKLVRARQVVSPYVLTMLPADVEDLMEFIDGDESSDTVWLLEQGGPEGELMDSQGIMNSGYGELFEEYEEATGKRPLLVNVHQIQTYNPGLFERMDFAAVEQVQAEMNLSVEILDRIIRHFKAQDKEVVVISNSFGSFIMPHYLALKGPAAADRYVITAGRLDMNEEVYRSRLDKLHDNSPVTYAFEDDGVTLVERESTGAEDDGTLSISERMQSVFQGVFGRHRYTELLENTDLTKVIYVYGLTDSAVGRLTEKEVRFLESKKADIVVVDGGHDSVFDEDPRREIVSALSRPPGG